MLSGEEVAKHNNKSSCWVILNEHAYDVTDYLKRHPGGDQILLQYAGQDATAVYEPIHPKGTLDRFLKPEQHLGPVDPTTYTPTTTAATSNGDQQSIDLAKEKNFPRLLSLCLSLDDVEQTAKKLLSDPAYIYYHSAADGLGSLENNAADWRKITLRPRVMRNVRRIKTSCTALGGTLQFPIFIAPAARAGLAHEDGELCLARGAARHGIAYCVSSVASMPHDDISRAFHGAYNTHSERNHGAGALWFQLYVANDKSVTLERIEAAKRGKYQALVITVDSAVIGKREEDEKHRAATGEQSLSSLFNSQNPPLKPSDDEDDAGNALPLRGVHSSTFDWDALPWIREAWQNSGPIALKGIQTAEDAALAAQYGIDAIYLSNHGGRQCDDAPSSIQTLLEIRRFFPKLIQERKMQIFLDGGVRRGADVVKALCLGATAVGLGRPFMYSVAMGDEGVSKAIQLLTEEIETTMRLIGATSVDQLNPLFVNTKRLEMELVDQIDSSGSGGRTSKL